VNSILHLQRTIGNQAVQRLLQSNGEECNAVLTGTALPRFGHDFARIPVSPPKAGTLQTKLAINEPGDEYEQEADHVAEQVMGMPDSALSQQGSKSSIEPAPHRLSYIQRLCLECKDQIQRRHEKSQPGTNAPTLGRVESVLRKTGRPLDRATRNFFQPRFGVDFGQVRVHADASAALSASEVSARAYTVGHNIVFNTGQYAPHTVAGRHLLAHELTHVVQQTSISNPETTVSKSRITPTDSPNIIFRYVSPAAGTAGAPSVIPDERSLESCSVGQVSLYGPEGEPRQEHINQGTTDCFLLAALAALTRTPRGRRHITSHIRPNPDGTYTVTLYNYGRLPEHIRMRPRFIPGGASTTPTLAQESGSPTHCIIWVALYERAVGHLRARGRGYYLRGMLLNTTFQMIAGSGFESRRVRGARHTETNLLNASREEKIRTWRSIWRSMQSGNEFVVVSTPSLNSGDGRLVGPHAYSITQAYTRGGDYFVDLYNPHGEYVNRVNFIDSNFQSVQILALGGLRQRPAESADAGPVAGPF
jgi:hypothetical protein